MADLTFESLREKGFYFPYATDFITAENREQLAQDAALVTTPNSAVPAEFTAWIDPMVIPILTSRRAAREIAGEVKKGDWTTSYDKFRVDEFTGVTTPYSDSGDGAVAGINPTWLTREQYRFQTTISYGELEIAVSGMARVNLVEAKQRAAANIIDVDENRFYLLGVANRDIYGLLNEPNLPSAITPGTAAGSAPASTEWADKTTKEIFDDIIKLYQSLLEAGEGNITMDSDLCLLMPPGLSAMLAKATDFNVSVQDMLNKYFSNNRLQVILIPELKDSDDGDNTIFMIARNILGTPTLEFAFSEKLRAGRVVPELSMFKQKFSSTTYGCILYRPFGVAQMTGV